MQLIEFLFVSRADPLLCHLYKVKRHIKRAKTFWKANSKQQNLPKQSPEPKIPSGRTWKIHLWLLVSSLACKELRSHYLILMSKKQAKNSTLPIITSDRSPKLRARRGNTELELMGCFRRSVDSSERWLLYGEHILGGTVPHTLLSSTSKEPFWPSQRVMEKTHSCFQHKEEEINHFEIYQNISILMRLDLGESLLLPE